MMSAIKKIIHKMLEIVRDSILGKLILKSLIYIHNKSYDGIKFFVIQNGLHPKHTILKYEKFFLENIDKDNVILDIGCGNGRLASELATIAKKVVGIDISQKNIDVANKKFKKPNIKFIAGDVTKYSFNEKFDYIVLSNVLEHIDKRVDFLKKLHSLTDTILLRVPLIDRDWLTVYKKENGYKYMLDKTHFIEYTINILQNELNQTGWQLNRYSIQFGEVWGVVNKK